MDGQTTFFGGASQSDLALDFVATPCRAKQFGPEQRQELAVQVLGGAQPVARLARQLQVSRKFLSRQARIAQEALESAFDPPPEREDVLFDLPVTKSWLHQLVLGLVLSCRSSCRGVVELLHDVFDYSISVGTVHNIVHSAVSQAQAINLQYDLSKIRIGAHDEIFQAGHPVLVGVDTSSTYCYLLSQEEQRDGDTWGLRLLELTERGFAPEATVADEGQALRAGQKMAMPGVPCRGDHFHLLMNLTELISFLEGRAYQAIEACAKLEREQQRRRRNGKSLQGFPQRWKQLNRECDHAIEVYDEIALLLGWMKHDILAVAGLPYLERCKLYDFVVVELAARVSKCPHRLKPICKFLKRHREDFLAYTRELDDQLDQLGAEFAVSPALMRRVLGALSRDESHPRRWSELAALASHLRGRFFEACEAVTSLLTQTIRASSLVENLNSRLRNYFFLRRQLGPDYLALLQFYLNHRVLERSRRPERIGKTPAELLTGQPQPHWLELLGYTRFQQA